MFYKHPNAAELISACVNIAYKAYWVFNCNAKRKTNENELPKLFHYKIINVMGN